MFKFGFWSQYWHSVTYMTMLFLVNHQIRHYATQNKRLGLMITYTFIFLCGFYLYVWVNIGPTHFIHPMAGIGVNMICGECTVSLISQYAHAQIRQGLLVGCLYSSSATNISTLTDREMSKLDEWKLDGGTPNHFSQEKFYSHQNLSIYGILP